MLWVHCAALPGILYAGLHILQTQPLQGQAIKQPASPRWGLVSARTEPKLRPMVCKCSHCALQASVINSGVAGWFHLFLCAVSPALVVKRPGPLLSGRTAQVKDLNLEEGGAFTVSSADEILSAL